jgi:hypothetical protein
MYTNLIKILQMFFNNDLLFVVGSIIVGGIFTYSFYNKIFTTNNSESLVNTSISKASNSDLSNLNLSNNLTTTTQLIDTGVQTDTNILVETGIQAFNTYTNTGMQTSSRMWYEYIKNWIDEILSTPNPNPQAPQYVDVGVQTNATGSLWESVKQWFLEVCSIRSSELSSVGNNRVEKWRNNIDSIQSINLHDSESPLTTIKFGNDTELEILLDPNDSASNVNEVISEGSQATNLQTVETANNVVNRVYDMSNRQDLLDLMNEPTIVFSINSAHDPADDIITFITPETSYDILRSTLDTMLNSVN